MWDLLGPDFRLTLNIPESFITQCPQGREVLSSKLNKYILSAKCGNHSNRLGGSRFLLEKVDGVFWWVSSHEKKLRGLTYFKTQYSRPLPLTIVLARLSRPDIIVSSRTIGNFCFILSIEIGQPNSYILSMVQIWCAENIQQNLSYLTIKNRNKTQWSFLTSTCLQHGNDSPLLSCHDPIYLQVEMRYASMSVPCSLLAALPAGHWLEPRCKAWDVPRKRSWHHRHLVGPKKRRWKLMIPWKRWENWRNWRFD